MVLHKKVLARFMPVRTDDLDAVMLPYIGKEMIFTGGGSPIDYGEYKGDLQMWCDLLGGWVPERDIQVIKVIEVVH